MLPVVRTWHLISHPKLDLILYILNKIVQDLHISILLLCIENHESTQNPPFFIYAYISMIALTIPKPFPTYVKACYSDYSYLSNKRVGYNNRVG